MKNLSLLFFLASLAFCSCEQSSKNIPALEEVSGVWMHADTMSIPPSVRNFRAQALVNRDMSSISWFASAPFSGGYHTGVMRVNGEAPRAELFRWYPWQALRQMESTTYKLNSTVKMVPEADALMWEITLTNTSAATQQYAIEQDIIGFISHYDKKDWPWGYPYPTLNGAETSRTDEIVNVVANVGLPASKAKAIAADISVPDSDLSNLATISWPSDSTILHSSKYNASKKGNNQLLISDTETDAKTGFHFVDEPDTIVPQKSGGTAYWNISLKKGESKKLRFFMTYATSDEKLAANLGQWSKSFDQTFAHVELFWKNRWAEMFKPNNTLFSGCFPVLETDDEAVRKIYYTGPLTLLYLLNTNLPAHKNVVLTGGPRWGATVSFFWDATEWSQIMAAVNPVQMKEDLISYIQIDPTKYFGQDNYTGKGVGNGYVANYWALFQMIRSYITMTHDYGFLEEVVNGKKVIDHLHDYAFNWKKISIYGKQGATDDIYKLAHFGDDPWNLLECVPTYIHIVPSFNAGYVWMMRETARFYEKMGEAGKAAEIKTEADEMLQRVLKLYAGNGVWHVLYPENKKIEVRHVLDFMYFGKYLSKDLSPQMKKEMIGFVEDELLTNTWMRALSLKDSAASYSDRPDHGPLGAFDGWPAGTIDAFAQMGHADKALDFYKRVLPVTYEGCWSQSHELWGDNKFNKNARVRIPERGWHNRESVAGIDFSQVVLKNFMGFDPEINGDALQPVQKINFSGTLHHVLYGGKYYSVRYENGKTTMTEE